jgi:hypothetical protein
MPSFREGMVFFCRLAVERMLTSFIRLGAIAGALSAAATVQAGHEVPYYPSFYPQEIRIEPLDPDAAGREFANPRDPLHAYIGSAPRFAGNPPADLKSVVSLRSFITVTINPRSERLAGREARCRATDIAASMLAKHPDLVVHSYPITPYHVDYIHHVDLIRQPATRQATLALEVRAVEGVAPLIAEHVPLTSAGSAAWDITIDEVAVVDTIRGAALPAWPTASAAKEGWFQAYHLLRPALAAPDSGKLADDAYRVLVEDEARDTRERVTRERSLIAALTQTCERAVIGYRLRRETHSDEFSNGVENVSFDSQSGLNSAVALRTIKLKDLPWNGWLRLGVADRPTAAWNPVAGFTDAAGRLVWSAVGDDAFLPIPYNSQWANNRAEIFPIETAAPVRQSIRLPADTLAADPMTGRIAPVAEGSSAMTKVSYRISASAFHDGTAMDTADFVFPYVLAFRWGGGAPGGATFDAEVASATAPLRQQFKGVRLERIEHTKLPIADLVFEYHWPIVEVFFDTASSNERANALIAPPWSSVPWHVLALMEAAVERGIAAFSQTEAERRRLPWLDLVRDRGQRDKLHALIKEFADAGHRPAALAHLVTAEAATARWQALDKFVEANGHLLVTNGPYKLKSVTPDVITLDVVREFTYPIGLGTFDFHAYPAKALITRVEHIGNRILMTANAEISVKQQRDHKVTVVPLERETLRGTLPIRPQARYMIVDEHGAVAAAGNASREADGRFAAALPALKPGGYRFFAAILLDGNALNPSIGRIDFQVN